MNQIFKASVFYLIFCFISISLYSLAPVSQLDINVVPDYLKKVQVSYDGTIANGRYIYRPIDATDEEISLQLDRIIYLDYEDHTVEEYHLYYIKDDIRKNLLRFTYDSRKQIVLLDKVLEVDHMTEILSMKIALRWAFSIFVQESDIPIDQKIMFQNSRTFNLKLLSIYQYFLNEFELYNQKMNYSLKMPLWQRGQENPFFFDQMEILFDKVNHFRGNKIIINFNRQMIDSYYGSVPFELIENDETITIKTIDQNIRLEFNKQTLRIKLWYMGNEVRHFHEIHGPQVFHIEGPMNRALLNKIQMTRSQKSLKLGNFSDQVLQIAS